MTGFSIKNFSINCRKPSRLNRRVKSTGRGRKLAAPLAERSAQQRKGIPMSAHLKSIWSVKPGNKIGHNTRVQRDENGWIIIYHKTPVVIRNGLDQTLEINTGGWETPTTAQRIRHGLREFGLILNTWDFKGYWRVQDQKGNAWTIRGSRLRLKQSDTGWARVF